jgi:CDP-diacylglycerol--glycerol-3-phosphate 3-phosphatidyltransferase
MKAFFDLVKKDKHNLGVPNLITLARLAFLPLIVYFISKNTMKTDLLATLCLCLSGVTDYFDGYFARKLKMRSELGRMLDPVVDKITVGVTMLFLAAYKGLAYWYVFMVIGRDILILVASLHIISRIQKVKESNLMGKYTLVSFLAVIVCYVLELKPYNHYIMIISAILIPFSLITYFKIYKSVFIEKYNSGK